MLQKLKSIACAKEVQLPFRLTSAQRPSQGAKGWLSSFYKRLWLNCWAPVITPLKVELTTLTRSHLIPSWLIRAVQGQKRARVSKYVTNKAAIVLVFATKSPWHSVYQRKLWSNVQTCSIYQFILRGVKKKGKRINSLYFIRNASKYYLNGAQELTVL